MSQRFWVKHDFLNWFATKEVSDYLDDEIWKRPYEIWNHASTLLHNDSSSLERVDAISTLKRSLNSRIKQFEKVYKITSLFEKSNNQYLQLLEQLGLIRPLLIKQLMEIRNEIEHKDKKPPKIERCLEFLDIVWYFLKTTDTYMRVQTNSFTLHPVEYYFSNSEETYWIETKIRIYRTWRIECRGWLPQDFFEKVNAPDSIEILGSELHSPQKWKEKGEHLEKSESDRFFSGSIVNTVDKINIAKKYFEAL